MTTDIKLLDKVFSVYLDSGLIQQRVSEIAGEINKRFKGKQPLFLAILNGSFIFASDLLKKVDLECEISFIKLASYNGIKSSGKVISIIGLNESISGKDIIILEDIIDTGRTIKNLIGLLNDHNPNSVTIISLLFKKSALIEDIKPDIAGFVVPDKFLLGYGLDYKGMGRNLEHIYVLNNL